MDLQMGKPRETLGRKALGAKHRRVYASQLQGVLFAVRLRRKAFSF